MIQEIYIIDDDESSILVFRELFKNDPEYKFISVKSDKIDLIVMDKLPAEQIVASSNELKILEGSIFEDSYGIAVKKGNTELLSTINNVLNKLMSENKIDEYIVKYSK